MPEQPWKVDVVPMAVDRRATEEGLSKWLRGEIKDCPPQGSYAGIVVDGYWRDLAPAIRKVHPNTPAIMLLAPDDAKVAGIDHLLGFFEINRLPEKMLELIAAKNA